MRSLVCTNFDNCTQNRKREKNDGKDSTILGLIAMPRRMSKFY
jgi:hypothetical protein